MLTDRSMQQVAPRRRRNVFARVTAVVLSVSLLTAGVALAISNQPYICAAGYYPQSPQYWYDCPTGKATQPAALTCSIQGWQAGVAAADGSDYAHWSSAQGKSGPQYKQDALTKLWFAKIRGKPCKANPSYHPPLGPKP